MFRYMSVMFEHERTYMNILTNMFKQNIERLTNKVKHSIIEKNKAEQTGGIAMDGKELKGLREHAGLTQQQLSQKTGVSRSLISQWENGVISVSAATKKRIADFFGVDAMSTPKENMAEDMQRPPRIVTSEAARQELDALTRQYMELNRNLEQVLGRLAEADLSALRESASALMQAVDTETVFRQVKSFQQHKTASSREELASALTRLLGEA